jgi:para-nitrobenzyl esterase
VCPQAGATSTSMDEDCLFLNIQRPSGIPLTTKLPVLVFFHGGGFESGSGNLYDGTNFIAIGQEYDQNVMVVRINYRLGLLGFLASSSIATQINANNTSARFNNGFRDMKAATDWVKAHVAAFGGDDARITIWGQSAGLVKDLL